MNNIDWFNEIKRRKKKVQNLEKQIKVLEKEIKSIGTTDPLEFIAEYIESETEYPCRVRSRGSGYARFSYINMYDKNSSKKQIHYDRPEKIIGGLFNIDTDLNSGEIMLKPIKDTTDPFVPIPHDIESVFKLMTCLKYENQYRYDNGQTGGIIHEK